MTTSAALSAKGGRAVGRLDLDEVAALRHSLLILSRRLRQQQAGGELSQSEAAVLGRVFREGPLTPTVLARAEHVQPPSMTRIIEQLEARGLIRRDPHPTDRRQVRITCSDAGLDLVERAREVRTAWLADQLGKLTPDQQDRIADAAEALAALADLP